MASNFKISEHRSSKSLHLKLLGDFDGNSAWEVYNLLKKNSQGFHRIIIDTNCLNIIYPFGVVVFHQTLRGWRKDQVQILFTGDKGSQISNEI